MMCGTTKCKACPDDPKCSTTPIGDLDSDKDKLDLKQCPTGFHAAGYKKYDQTWPLATLYLRVCHSEH